MNLRAIRGASILIVAACSQAGDLSPGELLAFDAVAWRAPSDVENLRLRMLPSLLSTKPLIGMTRSQAEGMLGAPDLERCSADSPFPAYVLGEVRTNDMLGETSIRLLLVRYDQNDVLIGYESWYRSDGAPCD